MSHSLMNILLPPYRERLASVFMLHRMRSAYSPDSGHSAEQLRDALRKLRRRGYRFVTLREIFDAVEADRRLPRNAIAFTLDDGYLDQARIAAPIFAEYDAKCTIFLITDFIDGRAWPWDARIRYIFAETRRDALELTWEGLHFKYDFPNENEKRRAMRSFREFCKHIPGAEIEGIIRELSRVAAVDVAQPPPAYAPISWDEARRLESQNVEFAPHTRNHYMMSGLSREEAANEIIESWDRMRQQLANPVPILAYPTGRLCDITVREVDALEKAGLTGAVTTEPGYVRFNRAGIHRAKRFFMDRFSFPDDTGHVLQYGSKIEYINMKVRYLVHMRQCGGWRQLGEGLWMQVKYWFGAYDRFEDIRWRKVERLIFVCRGNLCRSPYAEARARSLHISTRSFGVRVRQERRDKANEIATKNASGRHVDLTEHTTMALEDMDLGEHDLILGMEPWHMEQLAKREIPAGCQMSLLGLWAYPKTVSIPDPYGRDAACFELCFDQIDSALTAIAGWMAESREQKSRSN